MSEQLKPCPFCGGSAIARADGYGSFWCCCDDCGASTGEVGVENQQQADERWNKRVAAPVPAKIKKPVAIDGIKVTPTQATLLAFLSKNGPTSHLSLPKDKRGSSVPVKAWLTMKQVGWLADADKRDHFVLTITSRGMDVLRQIGAEGGDHG